jgi:hypothetical protein
VRGAFANWLGYASCTSTILLPLAAEGGTRLPRINKRGEDYASPTFSGQATPTIRAEFSLNKSLDYSGGPKG